MTIKGNSMEPTYKNGDLIFVNTATKKFDTGDIIVLYYGKEKIIKRIYAVKGDCVKIISNGIYINEIYITNNIEGYNESNYVLMENEYFVLGDNYSESIDSRYFGTIKKTDIIGKVIL